MFSRKSFWYSSLLVTAFLAASTYADVEFSSPTPGQVISGNTIDVEFAEGSSDPPISDFTSYTLQLCAGGNTEDDYTPLLTFTSTGDFSSSTYTAQITNLQIGGNTKNAYFLRTIGVTAQGTVINFSSRFTLSGMTGQFSAAVQSGLADVSGTAGPASVNNVLNPPAAAPAAPAAGSSAFAVPYTMQTGPIRYAPMASQAPSKITAKGNARQYPTSAYDIWSRSGMPAPDASQTVTDPYTYSYSSMEATIQAQPPPDDMQKFLNRWRD